MKEAHDFLLRLKSSNVRRAISSKLRSRKDRSANNATNNNSNSNYNNDGQEEDDEIFENDYVDYLHHYVLQRIARPAAAIPGESRSKTDEDTRAGEFYYDLGVVCARQRICIDIVVMSSLVSIPPPSQPGQEIQSNVREFVDVPTLSELCQQTCGRFKWLRVGNECGVAVMT